MNDMFAFLRESGEKPEPNSGMKIMAGVEPEANISGARIIVPSVLAYITRREIPKHILRSIEWEKITPAIKETPKNIKEFRDSTSSFMYKASNPPERLIDETLTDYLRKLGK